MIDVICWVGRWKDVAVSCFKMNEKCSCFLKTFFYQTHRNCFEVCSLVKVLHFYI